MTASAVLRVLARLAPSGRSIDVSDAPDLRASGAGATWLGYDQTWSADPRRAVSLFSELPGPVQLRHSKALNRLAAIDELYRDDRRLRAGWTVLTGPAGDTRLCTPLVSWPVRLRSGPRNTFDLEVAGDLETTPLVTDRDLADALAEEVHFGGGALREDSRMSSMPLLTEWVRKVSAAAGFPQVTVQPPGVDPLTGRAGEPTAVVGLVLYVGRVVNPVSVQETLWSWSGRPGIADTALAALYDDPARVGPGHCDGAPDVVTADGAGSARNGGGAPETLVSPLPLSGAQRAVVLAARSEPVTVVSGPPGCGKTHTLAALALDAVARGHSVLLATRSRHAAEVIGGMLRRAAGPTPVLFGDTELRRAVAAELAGGLAAPVPRDELRRRERALADAVAAVRRVERAASAALADETAARHAADAAELAVVHRTSAPTLFDGGADVDAARRALTDATRLRRGPLAGWRADRAARRLRDLVGAPAGTPLADVAAAVDAAGARSVAVRLAGTGGTALTGVRRLLADADRQAQAAAGAWLDGEASAGDRRSRDSRRAVAGLAAALRSGRATRRRLLAAVGGAELVRALPLWVGTLGDVEDLLPPQPGLFDLVVVDEASHVDQPLAAPALVRARRVVVAGDPRQLRHVSFVSAAQVAEAVAGEDSAQLAGLLDVPRMSLFDVAASATAVHWLDEHHRCAPHLVGFAGERFYPDRLALLTTHPSIADLDCIDTERVDGTRDKKGVNAVEVAAVIAHARRRLDAGVTSLGLLSPFRAQADAIERAVLDEFTVAMITAGGLRIGTVHSFQGSECDELVVSLALTDTDPAASWRFVDDPHLMAVLTTRARRHVHVVTSAKDPPGLVGAYLGHADAPPTETIGVAPRDEWTAELAVELRRGGLRVRTGYPVGRRRVDIVVGDDAAAVALETRPHPDGPEAHLARWRTLTGAGWTVHDAYPSRFHSDPVRAALSLIGELERLR
jgi:hypothetical protein